MTQGNGGGIRRHFNYSNVMSTLAVFMVIAGGTALAAKVKPDTVKSKSIKNGQVKLADLGSDSVDSSKVVDNSLTGADVNEGQLNLPPSVIPNTLPPSGPAGGSLTGTYPNPTLGANTVGTAQIQDNAVNSAKVAADTLTADDLATNSVGTDEIQTDGVGPTELQANGVSADELDTISVVTNSAAIAGGGGNGSVTASCPGSSEVLSGGGQPAVFGVEMTSSRPNANGWLYQAKNQNAGASTITAFALCIAP